MGDALGGGGSNSLFLDLEARRELGDGWAATLMRAARLDRFRRRQLPDRRPMASTSPRSGVLGGGDRLGLRIAQPLRIERAASR